MTRGECQVSSGERGVEGDRGKDMTRKMIALALGALLLALSCSVEAQQPAKLPKIGFLGVRPDDSKTTFESFKRQLQTLGYIEGKTIVYEYRNAENKPERLPTFVDELIRVKVDVLVVAATNEALAAKNATKTIPIVGLNLGDPVQSGLIESLAHPGANLTGITPNLAELGGKRLELLKETVAKLARVAVLWDPKAPASDQSLKDLQAPANALGLQIHSMKVTKLDEFDSAFRDAVKSGSGALTVNLSPMINANQRRVHDLAAKHRLPAIYARAEFVQSGGLMSYGADREAGFARAAVMVDKILKGAKPQDIPVEQPMKFELVINLKTAKQIGLTIPPNILARADKVIR
jgi:putative tryptophan/tyrosine transport system substrate-binding protein